MLKKDVAATFVGNGLGMLLSFAGAIIMSRILGAEGRGLLAMALLVPGVTLTVVLLGQDSVNATFAGVEKAKRGSLLLHSILFAVAGALVSVLVLYSFFYWLPIPRGNFANLSHSVVAFSIFVVPVAILNALILSLVRGVGKIRTAAVLKVFTSMSLVLCLLIFLALFKMGVAAAVGIVALTPLPAALAGIWCLRKEIDFKTISFDRELFGRSVRFGVPIALATFAAYLALRLDQGIQSYLVDEWQLGLYAVAASLAEQVKILPYSISSAFLPRLANELGSRRQQVPMVFRMTVVISFIAMAGVGIAGIPVILFLYGREFAGSILPFLSLLPGVVAMGGASILSGDLLTRNKPIYVFMVSFSALAASAVLNLLLVPVLGILGSAIAGTATYLLSLTLWVIFYRRESQAKLAELVPVREDVVRIYSLSKGMLLAGYQKIVGRAT